MKLKEKFLPFAMDNHIEKYVEHNVKEIEQIADEFAIGFSYWRVNDWVYDERWTKISDTKELLKIYKKQKKL